jgi:uncharacterized membrane protein HdeD (DUF308 family)
MSGSEHGNGNPGAKPGSDPAYSGAKAGTAGAMAPFGGSGFKESPFVPSGAMSALLAANWWAVALRGIFGILFGILALLMPGVTIAVLILWFAAYMLVDGVFAIASGIRAGVAGGRWGALIVEGVVDLIAGAIAFLLPAATLLAFVWICAAWAIISGVLLLSAMFRLHPAHGKWLMALGGVVSVAWGVLLFIEPISGAIVLTWWLGIYAILFGAALLAFAFRLRRRRQTGPIDATA